ncbi:hypothetical protein CRG98_042320, partial [Punica granatum]
MATNMAELLALLRGPNRASSGSTPPPGPWPTVDPTPGAPPTQAPENDVAPEPPTLYASTIHPFTSQLPPPPAPSERRLKRMEETIRALQANDVRPDARYGDCSLFPDMRLPPKFKVPEFKTYEGTTDPRHHLAPTSVDLLFNPISPAADDLTVIGPLYACPRSTLSTQAPEALLRVLTTAQVPKETPPNRIEETIGSIFSNTISFSDDELPSEGWSHSRALHIVCKCNNYIIGRVMIDNGSALNVCPVTTLKQMNVDLNRVRQSKTAVRAFDGSRREVNEKIDLLIDVGPCSFSITFQVLDIPNAFSLLLGRPWIYSVGAVPSSLHQQLKFIVEEKLITVKGEEDYAVYKETAVPYISIGDDENLPFHSFETISVIRDYGESGPSLAVRIIGKVLLRNNYIPGTGLGARRQGINRPIEIEEYKHRRGLGFRPS